MVYKKNILLVAIAFVLVAIGACFGLREIRKNNWLSPNHNISAPEKNLANQYSSEEYSLERGATGSLKSIDADQRAIVVFDGKDQRALIIPTTEVFRNGKRAALADIQKTDQVTVLGREKTKDSETFIADSIYASNAEAEVPISIH